MKYSDGQFRRNVIYSMCGHWKSGYGRIPKMGGAMALPIFITKDFA